MSSKEENCIRASKMSKDTQIELVKFVAVLRSPTAEKNEVHPQGDLFRAIGSRFGQILFVQPFSVKYRAGVFITFASNRARNDFISHLRSAPRHDELYRLRDMNRTMEIHVLLDFYLVPNALMSIMKASGIKTDPDDDDDDVNEPISPNQSPSRKASGSSRECSGFEKPPSFHLEQDRLSTGKAPAPPSRPPIVNRIVLVPMNENRTRWAGVKPPSPHLTLTPNAKHPSVPTEPEADRKSAAPTRVPSGKKPSSPSLLDRVGPSSSEPLSAFPMPSGNPAGTRATKSTMKIVQSRGITPPVSLNTTKDASEAHTTSRQLTPADSTPIQRPQSLTRTNGKSRCRPNPPDLPSLPNSSEREDVSRPVRHNTDRGSSIDGHRAPIHSDNGQEPPNVLPESEVRLGEAEDRLHSIETLLAETQAKLVASEKQVEAERSFKMEVQTKLFRVRVELKAWKLDAARTDEARRQAGLDRQLRMVDTSVQTDEERDRGVGAISEQQSASSERAERTKALPWEVEELIRAKAEDDNEYGRQRPVLHQDTPDKQKEIEELESTRMKLQTDLERQKSLYEGMLELKNYELQWARFDKGQHEIELKRQRISYEERLKELRDELLTQNVDVLAGRFPDASRSLIHAFVLTANLGKRKRKD